MLITDVEDLVISALGQRVEARYNYGRKATYGDIGFALHSLPAEMTVQSASEAVERDLGALPYVQDVHLTGKFLNVKLDRAVYTDAVLDSDLFRLDLGGSVLIEHTSINPNAAPHVGRARNAILGDTVARLLRALDSKVTTHYYVNDFGKQIALLLVALGPQGVRKVSFSEILDIYVAINAKAEADPSVAEQALDLLGDAEKGGNGENTVLEDLREIARHSLDGQVATLAQLGIGYEEFDFETDLLRSPEIQAVERGLAERGLTEVDEHGRVVVDLAKLGFDRDEGRFIVLRRANGSSMYMLRDIAYNLRKAELAAGGRNVVVLGEDHKLYMEQVSLVLSALGVQAPESVFYSYVVLKEGKMSTRRGSVVLLQDFYDQARSLARTRVADANPDLSPEEAERIGDAVCVAAVRFALLRTTPTSTITFDLNEALRFEGATGPYLQYSAVRCSAILANARNAKQTERAPEVSAQLWDVALQIDGYQRVLSESAARLHPNLVCDYLLGLAKAFNRFYAAEKVVTEEGVDPRRLAMVERVHAILEHGLGILGIPVPERM